MRTSEDGGHSMIVMVGSLVGSLVDVLMDADTECFFRRERDYETDG